VVLWASAFVAIRSAGGHFSPGALALGRLLVASVALGVMWLLSGDGWPPRAAWPGIIGSGVLWFGLYMITLNWGEREVDAGTAAMVVTIGPILIALLAGWLLREGFPRRLGAGMAVSLAGAIVVLRWMPGLGRRTTAAVEAGVPAGAEPALAETAVDEMMLADARAQEPVAVHRPGIDPMEAEDVWQEGLASGPGRLEG